jgi:hypothetical protein
MSRKYRSHLCFGAGATSRRIAVYPWQLGQETPSVIESEDSTAKETHVTMKEKDTSSYTVDFLHTKS